MGQELFGSIVAAVMGAIVIGALGAEIFGGGSSVVSEFAAPVALIGVMVALVAGLFASALNQ